MGTSQNPCNIEFARDVIGQTTVYLLNDVEGLAVPVLGSDKSLN